MTDTRKYPISEERFKTLINPIITEEKKKLGRPTTVRRYKFFCGIMYVLRTGVSWRDLPEEYGGWHIIYTRCKRWSENGFFWKLLSKLQSMKELTLDIVFAGSSIIPVRKHGLGALIKEG